MSETGQILYPPRFRGIVATHNRRGSSYSAADVERWIRLTRLAFKTSRIDLLVGAGSVSFVPRWLTYAKELDAVPSLRIHSPDVVSVPSAGEIGDVLFVFAGADWDKWETPIKAAADLGVSVRVKMLAPLPSEDFFGKCPKMLAENGVRRVDFVPHDPFVVMKHHPDAVVFSKENLTEYCRFLEACESEKLEANLYDIPFCFVESAYWRFISHAAQQSAEQSDYEWASRALAQRLFNMGAARARLVLQMLLGQFTSYADPIDRRLLPWILDHPWWRARMLAAKKLSRLIPFFHAPHECSGELVSTIGRELPPTCETCMLRRICDQGRTPEGRLIEGLSRSPIQGEPILDALTYRGHQRTSPNDTLLKWEAPVDLVDAARKAMSSAPPDIHVSSLDYRVEGHWALQLPDSVRWFSLGYSEQCSTPLARLEPPFTLAATFGSGIADFIGFGFGRYARILTPMTAFSHQLVLHVAADGRYVLLRDNDPVPPALFSGLYYVPERLGTVLEPSLSIWNIDNVIGTQNVRIWCGGTKMGATSRAFFSVVTVCTRYARRLQASLLSLAHQRGISADELEVIVAYVPGLDAVEDVLLSIEDTFPHLRIVRCPFSSEDAFAKGFMINESVRMASGEWVVLLDADILLPPDWFEEMKHVPSSTCFVVPDGRKMLPRDITARILLGMTLPWTCWEELREGVGEYRRSEVDGTPIGYCQCVRKSCFELVRYEEMRHFEGADWRFGKDMRERFGMEYRMEGMPVLHLDHGGSQWYGTTAHR